MNKPKIILFDIETIPDLEEAAKVWCQLSQFPNKTMKATVTSICCVGWKELGSKRTQCINAWDFKNWNKNINDDSEVCKAIHTVLKDADAVITHNGRRFDWKHIQTRFLIHGLPPPPKIPHIDTCLLARQNLLSFNNRLGYLGEWLANDNKLQNGGWELWINTMKRKKTAQKLMSKYCKQDVNLLEKVFNKLRPFAKNIPNMNINRTEKQKEKFRIVCPSCGSADVKRWGYYYTKTGKYQRIYCQTCYSYGRLDTKDNNPRSI